MVPNKESEKPKNVNRYSTFKTKKKNTNRSYAHKNQAKEKLIDQDMDIFKELQDMDILDLNKIEPPKKQSSHKKKGKNYLDYYRDKYDIYNKDEIELGVVDKSQHISPTASTSQPTFINPPSDNGTNPLEFQKIHSDVNRSQIKHKLDVSNLNWFIFSISYSPTKLYS